MSDATDYHKAPLDWPLFINALGFDEDKIENVAASFTDDISISWRVADGEINGPYSGRDAVIDKVLSLMNTHEGRWRHVTTNVIVEERKGQTATVRSYFILLEAAGGPVRILMSGWYRDKLQFKDGAWRMAERFIQQDNTFDHLRYVDGAWQKV
ncbi:nuclear transport factor 2 family protein [Labrenzia sp. DG1229]|uniref:nuclear transport factor 2 family protein n=1 Tax=Labrenzia sp. DG1229 TaxID=681847 RepID=UPI00048E0387|nr:nuclear transport factor 2 family protein [Labrenzia sp. DG1229]